MMDLTDIKLPKKTDKGLKADCVPFSSGMQDKWPYGLQLTFEKEQIDKIPSLANYKVGDKVMIAAEASVVEVRMSETQGNDARHSVEMQIEKISCKPIKPIKEMNLKEYRAMREKK